MRETRYGSLPVRIFGSKEELGVRAAADVAALIATELRSRTEVSVVLATGNSQLSFVRAVQEHPEVDWSRVSVLHMDEYHGMDENHPASFRRWMRDNLISHVPVGAFHGMRGDHQPVAAEVDRYEELLRQLDPIICVMGIGENGHLAFNDPPASFTTDRLVHLVHLDAACRKQQVGEGHFASVEETPEQALTMTVPALLRPQHVFVLAPEARKSHAVTAALEGPVTPDVPASVLTTVEHARLYLDEDSAAGLSDGAAS